jgi:hypothetical protein
MSRPAESQLRFDELPRFYPAIARALGEAGEDRARIQELVSDHLKVTCVGCRTRVPSDDLSALAFEPDPAQPEPSGRARLRLGYCAREGCNSRFLLAAADSGMVPWPTIFDRARHWMDQPEGSDAGEPVPSVERSPVAALFQTRPGSPGDFREQWRRLQYRFLVGFIAVAALFWWIRSGARIPGISPAPRTFEVMVPGMETPTAASPLSGPPPTNAPRTFRVQ